MSRFVDLSHPIVAGMTTYPRIPGPTMPNACGCREP